jgi:hypothetical protein
MKEKHISRVSLESNPGRQRKNVWGMKNEEFMADFILVSRRSLNDYEYTLFKYHFLLGADWKLCCRKLNIDRGTFFHEVYRIQQKLGRTFRELEPYALYPLDEYFGGGPRSRDISDTSLFEVETDEAEEITTVTGRPKKLLRFPVKKAA